MSVTVSPLQRWILQSQQQLLRNIELLQTGKPAPATAGDILVPK